MNRKFRCLVLGGKGFIGSHLVDGLLECGYTVRVFDRPNVAQIGVDHRHPDLEVVDGDFTSNADIAAAVVGCDICFHLVSTTLPKGSNLDPIFDIETNLMGTVRLLQHAVEAGVKKVVFLSSGGTVYGTPNSLPINEAHPTNPLCSYGITKLAIEKYLGLYQNLHGLDYTVLRLSNPFGERQRTQSAQGAVAVFLGKALRAERVEIWGDGSVVRDYIYVSDVITAMLAAVNYSGTERVFNIGSGHGMSLNEVLDSIELVTGKKLDRVYKEGRPFDVPKNVLSIEHAKEQLNWRPQIKFLDGLQRMAGWITEHGCRD
jgi:UDP-glucose 4-epimerase